MIERIFCVQVDLEVKPASLFVQKASRFECAVYIKDGDNMINAKSILGMISIGITKEKKITLVTDGSDEEDAMEELMNFFLLKDE